MPQIPTSITTVDHFEAIDAGKRPLHLCIGMFDGVHRGHQQVVGAALKAAQMDGGLVAILTFWPHPSHVLRLDQAVEMIMGPEEKSIALQALGADYVIQYPFDLELSKIEVEEFVPWLNQGLPSLKALYVGENFFFGHGRRGDATKLGEEGHRCGLQVTIVPHAEEYGQAISSTRIRELLRNGCMEQAQLLLGRPYIAVGKVKPGQQLGTKIGFPTLNLAWAPELRPRYGVYAVRVHSQGKIETLPGVANYGLRPTVNRSKEPQLEVHLLLSEGQTTNLKAEAQLQIDWLHFIRPEKKFASVDELRLQIAKDKAYAETFFVEKASV